MNALRIIEKEKKMKKTINCLLSLLVLLSICGCQNKTEKEETEVHEEENVETAPQESETEAADGQSLVVYFSRTGEQYTVGVIDEGNTAIVAKMIAEHTGGDLYEILPEEDYYPYTYNELTDVAKKEQNENERPAYQKKDIDLSAYDTVFIGAPVWWGDWPMIMYTFFENEDLSSKTLVPFSTHEGSGLSGFDKKLASAIPSAEILEGLAIRGNDSQNKKDEVKDKVDNWLNKLGY